MVFFVSLPDIGCNTLPVTATSGFHCSPDHLYWVMRAVFYRHIVMAIKTASFVGAFVDCCLLGNATTDDAVCIALAHCRGH